MSSTISLCICTYNRPDELDKCLHSVSSSRYGPEEIIVSDDSQNDAPARLVVSRYPGVIYRRGPGQGLGANRNACLAVVSQEFILFIDDDVCVDTDFFEKSRSALESLPPKVLLTGYEMNYLVTPGRKVTPHNSDFWGFQRVDPKDDYRAVVINSTFFPVSLFDQVRFDEKLRYGSEEIDMARQAISCGFSIQYDEDIYVHHHPSPVNRDEYQFYSEASRLYATFKAYWCYERSLAKSLAFSILAPPKLIVALVRRFGLSGFREAWQSIWLAFQYIACLY